MGSRWSDGHTARDIVKYYGADPELRQRLQQRGIGYVLGIGANRTVTTGAGAELGRLVMQVAKLR